MNLLAPTVEWLAKLYPEEVETSEDLVDAIAFIGAPFTPETVVRAGYGAGIVTFLTGILLTFLVFPAAGPLRLVMVFVLLLGVTLSVIHAFHAGPTLIAAFRRTEALGDTPNLIGRIVLRMQIQPAIETAVRFAADTGRGPLAESLDAHIDRAMGKPHSGLLSFADDWEEDFPALRRSAHLLATAEDAPEAERVRTLDRSLEAILDGTREQMADFTSTIRGPATLLYAFGVMLPLALVALIPAASATDISISMLPFILVYDVGLPAGLVAAAVWILVRRPVAFPPPDIDRSHPDVPTRVWYPAVVGLGVGAGAAALTYLLGPPFLAPMAGIGMGLGSFLLSYFKPIKDVRTYVRNVETHLTDALYLIGRQIAEGHAVERAIKHAGDRVPAETGEVFETASGLQQRLHMGVEQAFFGEYGALNHIPSARAHGTASLVAIAAEEGQPAGRAIVSMADHLEELQEVENEAKRQLSQVTGTLDQTASYFGPLVGGATVALADRIAAELGDSKGMSLNPGKLGEYLSGTSGSIGSGSGQGIPTPSGGGAEAGAKAAEAANTLPVEQLAVFVGVYLVFMAIILTTLSVALRHGLDKSLAGYHIGRALVTATPLYIISMTAVSLLV